MRTGPLSRRGVGDVYNVALHPLRMRNDVINSLPLARMYMCVHSMRASRPVVGLLRCIGASGTPSPLGLRHQASSSTVRTCTRPHPPRSDEVYTLIGILISHHYQWHKYISHAKARNKRMLHRMSPFEVARNREQAKSGLAAGGMHDAWRWRAGAKQGGLPLILEDDSAQPDQQATLPLSVQPQSYTGLLAPFQLVYQ